MKPFDIKLALDGHPVITRDGRKVLQIAYFPQAIADNRVVAFIEKDLIPTHFYEDGKAYKERENTNDLFLAPCKKKFFIVIEKKGEYLNSHVDCISYQTSCAYETKEELLKRHHLIDRHIVEVEIEE